jgi:Ca-activated chloride channel family protein
MPAPVPTLAEIAFTQAEGFLWLLAVAVAALLVAIDARWRRGALRRLADANLLTRIAPSVLGARTVVRAALVLAAMALLAVALADPRGAESREEVEQRGVDLMVVVDVSRSMLAEDAAPNRLARARQFAADLVEELGSDRVGLVEFAGVPAVRCPLTFNHRTFLSQLALLSPKSTARGGSMLGDAIRLAAESLDGEGAGRAIVVLSDGEDMESEPVEAAAAAYGERGVRIVTIGLGDAAEGARIPVFEGGARRYLVHEGEEVWTRMDPTLLAAVAEQGGGFFVEAGTSQADMGDVARALTAMLEASTRERGSVAAREPLFQWFACAALLALLVEATLRPRGATRATAAALVPEPRERRRQRRATAPGGST